MEIKFKKYSLRSDHGGWLGDVVITSDGMFSAVTDWGHYAFQWRSFGGSDFRDFLCGLNEQYFSRKMYLSNADFFSGSKAEEAANRFSSKILPALQVALGADIELDKNWEPPADSHNKDQTIFCP